MTLAILRLELLMLRTGVNGGPILLYPSIENFIKVKKVNTSLLKTLLCMKCFGSNHLGLNMSK